MSMEAQEEAVAAAAATANSSSSVDNEYYSHAIVKGKRTKRRRLRQYLPLPVAAGATPSTSSSGEVSGSVGEEEEDMANCLILLAQGRALEAAAGLKPGAGLEAEGAGGEGGGDGGVGGRGERYTSRRLAEAATMTHGKVSFYVYECKTCNKCFPSFQALGGHRSSHKKLKMATVAAVASEEKKTTDDVSLQISIANSYLNSNLLPYTTTTTTTTSSALHHYHNNNNNNNIGSSKHKVHECSVCGSEFSSGQALGGHMRRHRTEAVPSGPQEVKEKNLLSLDLNLPAPEDDDRGDLPGSASLGFSRKPPLIFSASALVDCHY